MPFVAGASVAAGAAGAVGAAGFGGGAGAASGAVLITSSVVGAGFFGADGALGADGAGALGAAAAGFAASGFAGSGFFSLLGAGTEGASGFFSSHALMPNAAIAVMANRLVIFFMCVFGFVAVCRGWVTDCRISSAAVNH